MKSLYAKPTAVLKPLNAAKYPNVPAVEIDRLNGMRKIINLRGGPEKAIRAFNRQTDKPVAANTFIRYMLPGSAKAAKVATFLLTKY